MIETQKHKTVGISLPPELRDRANERARELGLSFSRYVALCVETELRTPQLELPLEVLGNTRARGEATDLNLDTAIDVGGDYGAAKALAIAFEEDVQAILESEDVCFTRMAQIAHLRTDFLIQNVSDNGERTWKVAIECKHSVRNRYTVTLGQAIILKSLPGVDAVLLCVPYTRNFDRHVRDTFRQMGIPVTTPDNLIETLSETFARLGADTSRSCL